MRVSEVYASTQGEGPNVGETTVFVRFAGCNLRCPGWPCDTQHAIDPAYRAEWQRPSDADLLHQVLRTAESAGARLITFTGGEPFLQQNQGLRELTGELLDRDYRLEAFTNGTILYDRWAVNNVDMIMDWKLPGSGEDPLNENRIKNLIQLSKANTEGDSNHSIKFVIKDERDFHAALGAWIMYVRGLHRVNVYYGRVWEGDISNAELVEWVMHHQLPWKLNVQMHNYIWPAHERAR